MKAFASALAIGSLLASPLFATPNEQQMRQLSEVVFANYPPDALARGEQGAVYFLVTLDKNAHATSCKVTYGSGYPLLDEETCDLIVQHAVFSKLKDANGRVTKETQEGVVYWRIPGAPAPSVAPVALNPASARSPASNGPA
jgi:periplasmic protein TonB